MSKLLSIITVCKNSAQTIERTINSVKLERQNLDVNDDAFIEYIIIDGGSTDNTLSIIRKHRKSVEHLVSENDSGIYEAMNKGWKLASGSFVLFLNSDDFLKKSSLKNIVDLVQYAKEYNISVITATTEVVRANNRDGYKLSLLEFGLKSVVSNNQVPHPSTIVSRNILKKYGGFDQHYKIASDYKFFIQVLGDKKNEIIASSFAWVSMQSGGASDQYKSIYDLIKNRKRALDNSTELLWLHQINFIFISATIISS